MLESAQSQLSTRKKNTVRRWKPSNLVWKGLKAQVLSLTMQLEEQQREKVRVDERVLGCKTESDHSERT